MTTLSQHDAHARIRLLRSPNIGPVSYRQLLRRFGNAENALAALPDLAARGGAKYRAVSADLIRTEIAAVKRAGARYIFHDSPDYPPLLAMAEGAPPILIARGHSAMAQKPAVAMVGARNSSAAAMKLARNFAQTLAEAGYVVVSGLARGIDGAAHSGALAAGDGGTIAVIASGIDVVYPREHQALHEQIAEQGLLLTEHPPGTEPLSRQFPARNRIIAGIAAGTVVVEAAPKSGSLITARLAGEYGREVMAVPGSPLDPRSQGCNQLIREGATLVQTPEDVLELLVGFDGVPRSRLCDVAGAAYHYEYEDEADTDPADLTALLTTAPIGVDELIRASGAGTSAVQLALIELELAGRLERHAGGRVSLAG